jgi:hypothetical protein
MELNYLAIVLATIAQMIFGAIWYMPIFGKVWGQMHGFDQVPPEKQKEMMKDMWKLMVLQLVLTLLTTFVFALVFNDMASTWHAYGFGGFIWLGFIFPTQAAAVIFGGTKPEWVVKKIAIMSGAALINMMLIATVFRLF